MAQLLNREYPFCSERKEFRLVMRALRSGWLDGEAAIEIIDQALTRISSGSDFRETLLVIRAAIAVERRNLNRYVAEVEAQLNERKKAIRQERLEIMQKEIKLREWIKPRKS